MEPKKAALSMGHVTLQILPNRADRRAVPAEPQERVLHRKLFLGFSSVLCVDSNDNKNGDYVQAIQNYPTGRGDT